MCCPVLQSCTSTRFEGQPHGRCPILRSGSLYRLCFVVTAPYQEQLCFLMMLEHDGADQHTKCMVMRCNENDYLDS